MTHHPPAWFVRRLAAIHPELRAEWLPRDGRWAILQVLHNTPSLDDLADAVVREVVDRYHAMGYSQVSKDSIRAGVYENVARTAIVLVVENADKSYRPLDHRTLTELRERVWNQRHRGVKEWIAASDRTKYENRRSIDRANDGVNDAIKKDRVFARLLADAGLGIKHTVHGRPERQLPA